ncbi:D-alanyl-D-alanine carboxypeptidase DacC [Vibrio chagasii]|nr:D-alanyl-D-alanine carboxypeptidase DacC [Vibrio chagasii]
MKIRNIALACLFTAVTLNVHAYTPSVGSPDLPVSSYILIDHDTGTVLAEKNADESLNPASLTKLMTSYVIGEEVKSGRLMLDDQIKVSKKAWARNFPDSSKMFIEAGTYVKAEDLNKGIIIQSGNDACVAMAEHIAGSESSFVDLMNAWAELLGLDGTAFRNSHGLDAEGQRTTARDISTLTRAIIKDLPEQHKYYKETEFSYNGISQRNRNGLLHDNRLNVDGMKTGYTSGAGYNLVTTATNDGMRVISVVMGAESEKQREAHSRTLINHAFRNFETITVLNSNSVIAQPRVWYSEEGTVSAGVSDDLVLTILKSDSESLSYEVALNEDLFAPVRSGDPIGVVNYYIGGELKGTTEAVALESIEKGSYLTMAMDYVRHFLNGLQK